MPQTISKRLDHNTELVVRAICADYSRRDKLLKNGAAPDDVLRAYRLMNLAVDDAVANVYDMTRAYAPDFSELIRRDIGEARGYNSSPLSGVMSEGSYKKYKRLVKTGIARRLLI